MSMEVGELIQGQELRIARADWPVRRAIELMAQHNIGSLPVIDEEKLVGVLSERDIIVRVIHRGRDPGATKVADAMTSDLVVGEVNESIERCLRRMTKHQVRHLPIIRERCLVGYLSIHDILTHQVDTKDEEIRLLNHFIAYEPPHWEQKR